MVCVSMIDWNPARIYRWRDEVFFTSAAARRQRAFYLQQGRRLHAQARGHRLAHDEGHGGGLDCVLCVIYIVFDRSVAAFTNYITHKQSSLSTCVAVEEVRRKGLDQRLKPAAECVQIVGKERVVPCLRLGGLEEPLCGL